MSDSEYLRVELSQPSPEGICADEVAPGTWILRSPDFLSEDVSADEWMTALLDEIARLRRALDDRPVGCDLFERGTGREWR